MNKRLVFSLAALMAASLFFSVSGREGRLPIIAGLFCQPCAAAESKFSAEDRELARQLRQKKQAGESLTPDEQTFLKDAEQKSRATDQSSKRLCPKPPSEQ